MSPLSRQWLASLSTSELTRIEADARFHGDQDLARCSREILESRQSGEHRATRPAPGGEA